MEVQGRKNKRINQFRTKSDSACPYLINFCESSHTSYMEIYCLKKKKKYIYIRIRILKIYIYMRVLDGCSKHSHKHLPLSSNLYDRLTKMFFFFSESNCTYYLYLSFHNSDPLEDWNVGKAATIWKS